MLVLFMLRVLVKIGIELSSVIVGGLIMIIFGCIIYAIVQQMWPSMWILIAMEVVLIMVTAGAGMLDVLLEEASFNLGLLMRS
jgi:NADH-quinone oxidoreductase subunit A